jgi:hypothetical protein
MAPLTSPFSVLVSTISFISIWALMQHHVQAESRVASIASKLITYNNTVQPFLSITLLTLILLSITTQPALSGPARLAYHYSKFYEYSDILLIAAQGKHDMISLHFGFHHFTTPWYTTMRVVRYSAGWEVFAGLNALHHTLSMFSSHSFSFLLHPFPFPLLVYPWLRLAVPKSVRVLCGRGVDEEVSAWDATSTTHWWHFVGCVVDVLEDICG